MTERTVTKKGHADWGDLVGKEISFEWFDGYEDYPYFIEGVFEGTRYYSEDPRYPKYYILVDGGGTSVYDHEEVEVTVYD